MNDHIDAIYGNLDFVMTDVKAALSCIHDFWDENRHPDTGMCPEFGPADHAYAALLKINDLAREAMKALEPHLTPMDG